MSTKDFAAVKPVISRDKSEPRQRTAANGGGEPPSVSETTMLDLWLEEHDKTNLVVTESLFAQASRSSTVGRRNKKTITSGRL